MVHVIHAIINIWKNSPSQSQKRGRCSGIIVSKMSQNWQRKDPSKWVLLTLFLMLNSNHVYSVIWNQSIFLSHIVSHNLVSSCLILYCFVLYCLVSFRLVSSTLALTWLALPYIILYFIVLTCIALPCLALYCLALPYIVVTQSGQV